MPKEMSDFLSARYNHISETTMVTKNAKKPSNLKKYEQNEKCLNLAYSIFTAIASETYAIPKLYDLMCSQKRHNTGFALTIKHQGLSLHFDMDLSKFLLDFQPFALHCIFPFSTICILYLHAIEKGWSVQVHLGVGLSPTWIFCV